MLWGCRSPISLLGMDPIAEQLFFDTFLYPVPKSGNRASVLSCCRGELVVKEVGVFTEKSGVSTEIAGVATGNQIISNDDETFLSHHQNLMCDKKFCIVCDSRPFKILRSL